jgi:glycerophosphoryl diester phosphodiesterase
MIRREVFIQAAMGTHMRLIAHRGFGDVFPENTLGALRQAAEVADMIEIDIQRCGSGELVVFHDDTVDDATDSSGRVDELSVAELAALDVDGSGDGIPTLTTALDVIPGSVGVVFELKAPDTATDALTAANATDNDVVISSFHADVLRAVRTADTDAPLAFVIDATPGDDLDLAIELDCDYVHPHWSVCLVTDIVEDAHEAGIEVNVWTIDSAFETRLFDFTDFDGIIADRPDVL